ncbi:MAG: Bacteriophage Mu Gam like protein [Syntrophus sp. PtaB.Bin075]|nr:MAG: Bacteriophage Mu Gam like protein [Syntrophus sp. PtaB.Bin075]
MASLGEIEQLTKEFSTEREKLSERIRSLEDEISAIKRKRLPVIKTTVNAVVEKQDVLKAALEASRNLFVKPKTMILHGVKIGFQKAKGKISWADDDQVVKLIKKHLPDQADILIKTTEKPIKDALANLPASDLKRIGVTVQETSDQVVIKSTDSEIDKFVDALLKEDELKEAQEAA